MGLLDKLVNNKNTTTQSLRKAVDSAIKHGGSSAVLNDNRDTILKAVRKYEGLVAKGTFGTSQRTRVLNNLKKELPLKSADTANLKKVLTHLGQKPPVSRAHIRRADEGSLGNPHFAGQNQLANNSGLSSIATPNLSHTEYQPVASIAQLMKTKTKSGNPMDVVGHSTNSSKPMRPIIPLTK